KTNEDYLKSKVSISQQHDYKNAELCRSEDRKNPELKGDVGKHLKTHNICLNTAAGLTKDMIIPEDIKQQPDIQKSEIPVFMSIREYLVYQPLYKS
ncbi:hypothetical protein MTR67_039082, partial [Solanum verrucosum]